MSKHKGQPLSPETPGSGGNASRSQSDIGFVRWLEKNRAVSTADWRRQYAAESEQPGGCPDTETKPVDCGGVPYEGFIVACRREDGQLPDFNKAFRGEVHLHVWSAKERAKSASVQLDAPIAVFKVLVEVVEEVP